MAKPQDGIASPGRRIVRFPEIRELKLIRLRGVIGLTGSSRSDHYGKIRDGLMVPPIEIGARARAYPEHEIQAIIAARIAGRSNGEIRALVSRLIGQRVLASTEHHEQSLSTQPNAQPPHKATRLREVDLLEGATL